MAILSSPFIGVPAKRFLVVAVYLSIQIPQNIFYTAACCYPNGDLQVSDVAWNSSANVSICYGPGWSYSSNSVCMLSQDTGVGSISRIGSTYRSSCTDKTWKSSECPAFCKGVYFCWHPGSWAAFSSCHQLISLLFHDWTSAVISVWWSLSVEFCLMTSSYGFVCFESWLAFRSTRLEYGNLSSRLLVWAT